MLGWYSILLCDHEGVIQYNVKGYALIHINDFVLMSFYASFDRFKINNEKYLLSYQIDAGIKMFNMRLFI
jgi:hypothetical protein